MHDGNFLLQPEKKTKMRFVEEIFYAMSKQGFNLKATYPNYEEIGFACGEHKALLARSVIGFVHRAILARLSKFLT